MNREPDRQPVLLVLECDLSLSTGYSINERESALALMDRFPDLVKVIAPRPAHPEVFRDERITYVVDHRRHHPLHYLRFLWAGWKEIKTFQSATQNGAIAFRLGLWPILPILAARKGSPVFLKTLSGYALYGRKDKRLAFRVASWFLKPFFHKAVRSAAGMDTPSHAFVSWFAAQIQVPPERMLVLPNGVNPTAFTLDEHPSAAPPNGLDRFAHRIGYVGAMDTIRNLETALEALTLLHDFPDLGLVLVGRGPFLDTLKRKADELGVMPQVAFLGFKPYKEIPAIMGCFDVALDLTCVSVPVGDTPALASFSQKIPQYLSCGLPVIACRCPDTAFLEENGLGQTVAPNDARALAEAVRRLLQSDPPTVEPEKNNTYAHRNFSYASLAEKRMQYWQDCLRKSE